MRTMQNLVNQDNPNVPADAPALRAFNLIPGVAFMSVDEPDPRVWVVMRQELDDNFERNDIWARCANDEDRTLGLARHKAFSLHYCDLVAFVGIVRNPEDDSDNDWGTE